MKWNARYLFEYGHALHKLHRNEESNVVMKEALKVSGDPMILNIIGKNEQEAGNYAEAEYWLIRSTHRLPGRSLSLFPVGKAICGTGVLSTAKTGTGRKDGNGERAEGAIHGHQANEGGNKEITLIFLFGLNCINA